MMESDQNKMEQSLNSKMDMLCLEREDTLYILRNGNIGELESQSEYYKGILGEIRDMQRAVKKAKLSDSVPLEEIKEWDKKITERKREEEELYYDMIKVLEDHQSEERELELEKLKLSSRAKDASVAPAPEQHARMPKLDHEISGNSSWLVSILESVRGGNR